MRSLDSRWRVLGLDVGAVRTGVAISDADRLVATPVETVSFPERHHTLGRIIELLRDYEPGLIVIGKPINLQGKSATAVRAVEKFAEQLLRRMHKELPELECELTFVDERLSSAVSAKKLRDVGRNTRNMKSVIDQAAAMSILQTWLDAHRAKNSDT